MECRLPKRSWEVCALRTFGGLINSLERRVWIVCAAAIVSVMDGIVVEDRLMDVVDEVIVDDEGAATLD
jgi:hypothetical protein